MITPTAIELLGNAGLCAAVLSAAGATLLALAGSTSAGLLRASRALVGVFAIAISVSAAALVMALVGSDFGFAYVAGYTERSLPLGYRLAAFWAGQEGSLLLWAWLLGVMSLVFVIVRRRGEGTEASASTAGLSIVLLFFAALMLFAANPFKLTDVVPSDGRGLNPMLQDPAMIAHPPLLFIGYAAYTFPFVMLIGALVARRRDAHWLAEMRPWAIVAWLFLGAGIVLGAQWAYVELGWGGYWAWDPVENASLLPWLTGTALLHSIMVQQHRGMFKKWNATLIAGTFVLCIFGTYLTRSGVIQSVHAFERSLIGTFFLAFLGASVLVSVILIIARRQALRPEHDLDGLLGKEGMFLATNVLLVGMMLLTLVGTIFPIISRTVSGQEVTVGATFYNKVVAPLGLLLVALMAVGPILAFGAQAAEKLARGIVAPLLVAAATVAFAYLQGLRNPWAMICTAVAAVAVSALVIELIKAAWQRSRSTNENLVIATLRLLDSNHRRYGGQIVHLGMLMMVVGIVGSSLFSVDQTVQLKPGQSATVAGRTVTYVNLQEVRKVNFTAVQAEVKVTESGGRTTTLRPQRRFYDKSEQPNAEVDIDSNWRVDVYANLAGWEDNGRVVAIQIIVNPLVSFLWVGGIVMTLGGLICLTPRLLAHPASSHGDEPPQIDSQNGNGHARRRDRKRAHVPTSRATPREQPAMRQTLLNIVALTSVLMLGTSCASKPAEGAGQLMISTEPSPTVVLASSEAQSPAPATQPASPAALPAGHPPTTSAGAAGSQLPAGHPDIPSMSGSPQAAQLPSGHPDISSMTRPGPQQQLPSGHPDISKMPPSTQPGQPAYTTLQIQAVQGTVGGPAVGGEEVTVEVYNHSQVVAKIEAKLDAQGKLSIGGLPVGPTFQPMVTVKHAGVSYEAAGNLIDASPQQITVNVYETTDKPVDWEVRMRHVMLQPTADGVQVVDMMAIDNPTDRAYTGSLRSDGNRTSFELPLPADVKDLQLMSGFHSCCTKLENGKLVNSMAIVPGTTQYQFTYTVPQKDGAAEVIASAPVATKHLIVFAPDDGTTITADGMESGTSSMGGTTMRYFKSSGSVPAGKQVKLVVSGTPVKGVQKASAPASSDRIVRSMDSAQMAKTVAGAGGLIIFLVGGAMLLRRSMTSAAR